MPLVFSDFKCFSFPSKLEKDKERVFYASIPVSVMREDIEKRIWNKNYFWSLAAKNNGIHLVLMWCTFYGEPMWLFVDRAYTIYRVVIDDFPLPSILFDGTVLDGELVPLQQGGFAFEVYDCIQACGVPCGELNYLIRQRMYTCIFASSTKTLSFRLCILVVQKMHIMLCTWREYRKTIATDWNFASSQYFDITTLCRFFTITW